MHPPPLPADDPATHRNAPGTTLAPEALIAVRAAGYWIWNSPPARQL